MPRILQHVLASVIRIATSAINLKIECMKSFADDIVVTYDEIVDTLEGAVINPSDGTILGLLLSY